MITSLAWEGEGEREGGGVTLGVGYGKRINVNITEANSLTKFVSISVKTEGRSEPNLC